MKTRDWLLNLIPAVLLLPLMWAKIPTSYHAMRESTQYFQTLALLQTGFEAFTFTTPNETTAGLELYSMLNVPLLALGYIESGRFISLLSAITAVFLLIYITYTLTGQRTPAVFAGLFLWLHPLFLRHAYSYVPEALSIALTVGAVATTIRYLEDENRNWIWLTILLIFLGIVNHTWEAIILLPVCGLLVEQKKVRYAVLVAGSGILGVLVARIVSHIITPSGSGGGPSQVYIHNIGPVFLQFSWWTGFLSTLHPFEIAYALTIPLSVVILVWASWRFYQTRSTTHLLVLTWILSGISIPFLLPGALPWHRYYLWGVLAPLALSGGLITQSIKGMIARSLSDEQLNTIQHVGVAVLIFGISINGGILEGGYLHGTDTPVMGDVSGVANYHIEGVPAAQSASAGKEIRDGGYNGGKIVFVGDWDRAEASASWSNLIRVSVYSGILFKEWDILDSHIYEINPQQPVPGCEYRIIKHDSNIRVESC